MFVSCPRADAKLKWTAVIHCNILALTCLVLEICKDRTLSAQDQCSGSDLGMGTNSNAPT